MEELLRYSSPSRAVFRQAAMDVALNPVKIARRSRVILMLAAANRDSARYPEPDRLNFRRTATGHLAFGAGPYSCVGANLIRVALRAATTALLDQVAGVELAGGVDWIGGFAICGPASLPVTLTRG
jgi:cytochrome P450